MRQTLPELLWYGNSLVDLELPDDWVVSRHPMRGAERRALTARETAHAIQHPIGSPRIRDLARGRKRAVVVFDDMTRPTRVDQIGPLVLDELIDGGIAEDDISFVCALGTHGALTQHELRKKVGTPILERFRVYNHNCYENCVDVGTTSRGTRLLINREVMSADLKIGIGCVTAHAQVGFSGGGKILLPGVAHMESITHYHRDVQQQAPHTTGLGNFDQNVMRFNIEEAARMCGFDFKIDVMVNERGETTHVFAGDVVESHLAAVEVARDHYAIAPRPQGNDVVIANAFCKANEMAIAALVGLMGLRGLDGSLVILANAPEGQVIHYLVGRFGTDFGGAMHPVANVPPGFRLIVQTPHLDRTFADWVGNPEAVTFSKSWEQTLEILRKSHGSGTRVGLIPSATMAYHPAH